MLRVSVVVYEEFRKECRGEIRRVYEKLELETLVLETVAHFERPPCKAAVLRICLELRVIRYLIFIPAYLHQRILVYPVHILGYPFLCIFLVSAYPVGISHRGEPFVAVELPAQFVVLDRPVSPVDVISVVERRLIAVMCEKSVIEGIVCPLLLLSVDFDFLYVTDFRGKDAGAVSVIVQERYGGKGILPVFMQCLDFLQSGIVEVKEIEGLGPEFLCVEDAGGHETCRGGYYRTFHDHVGFPLSRLSFNPVQTCYLSERYRFMASR